MDKLQQLPVIKLLLKQAFTAGASSVSITERDKQVTESDFEKWYNNNFKTATKDETDRG
jgi:hypothetical protein